MDLYYEEDTKDTKKSKLPLIIGIIIGFLIILMIVIIAMIMYLKGSVMKITLDQVNANELENIFHFEETETGTKIYIPIIQMSGYLNYNGYTGDFKVKSEDKTKCSVENENEVAMFTLGSNKLIKSNKSYTEYQYIDIDEKVIEIDGQLYTTPDGIEKAFNVQFMQENNQIAIYTMDYLVQYYVTKLGIENYSEEYTNQKAIFEGLLIVKSSNEQYGVIQVTTGTYAIESKYDNITYLPTSNDFLVKSNGKYGIVSTDAKVKIKIAYDDIKLIDTERRLYLIKQKNAYGVIDKNGDILISPEYQQIGINSNSFTQNGIENQYILFDQLIPVKSNNMWGFFDITGKKIKDFEYTSLGCTTSKVSNSYPVLVIPSYKMVVVAKGNLYNLMRMDGSEFIDNNFVFDSIYMRSNSSTGENTFFMTYNGETRNIEEYLARVEKNPT